MSEKIDEGLLDIGSILERYKQNIVTNGRNLTSWQEQGLKICAFLNGGFLKRNRSSIFACCKKNMKYAHIAFLDCKELGKPEPLYFFKVFNVLVKKYEHNNK